MFILSASDYLQSFTTFSCFLGNWSPSDFPTGDKYPPYNEAQKSVNRDMLVAMKGEGVVNDFNKVFVEDWWIGNAWEPKSGIHYAHE